MRVDEAAQRGRRMLESLPFKVGESPFRIKGVAYRGHLDYCERTIEGGHAAVLSALHNPDVTRFFDQPFMAGGRYDIFPLMFAGFGAAKAAKTPLSSFLRERARYQVAEDVRGVYRMLLMLVSPDFIAKRMPPLIAQYLDFGSASTIVMKGEVVGVQHGMPLPLVGWYVDVTETYIEELLRRAGAEEPQVHYTHVELEGQREGLPLCAMHCRMWWKA